MLQRFGHVKTLDEEQLMKKIYRCNRRCVFVSMCHTGASHLTLSYSHRLPLIELQDSGDYQCEVPTSSGRHLYDIVTLVVRRESWPARPRSISSPNNN